MRNEEIDGRVIEGCRQGDPDAFRQFFETYADRVYSVALHYSGGNAADAADIAQQAFVKAHRSLPHFREDARVSTWLYRIVVNACLDARRRRQHDVPLDDVADVLQDAGAERQDVHQVREQDALRVRDAVGALSPKLRVAILLKYFDDLSYEEMAEALGCSLGTVASRLSRAHQALARVLARRQRAMPESS